MIGPSPELRALVYARTPRDTGSHIGRLLQRLYARPDFAPEPGTHGSEAGDAAQLTVRQARPPHCTYRFEWPRHALQPFGLSVYSIDAGHVRDRTQLAAWLDCICGLLTEQDAWYALVALDEELTAKNIMRWPVRRAADAGGAPGTERSRGVGLRLEAGIPGVYWGNYLGPAYVEWFGRERIEAIAGAQRRWSAGGGAFITTADTPFEWNTPAAAALQSQIRNRLGRQAFFDHEAVRQSLRSAGPVPDHIEPEQLQEPRSVPPFPFAIAGPDAAKRNPNEERATRLYFERRGLVFLNERDGVLVFADRDGSLVRVSIGPRGTVLYQGSGPA